MRKELVALAAGTMLLGVPSVSTATSHAAAQAAGHSEHHGALSEGEVRRVDKEARKLTIRHGPIANLDMPPMTMVFQVPDVSVLDQVKVGRQDSLQGRQSRRGVHRYRGRAGEVTRSDSGGSGRTPQRRRGDF